jgi:hypothetical protein
MDINEKGAGQVTNYIKRGIQVQVKDFTSEKKAVIEFLQNRYATAAEVSTALNIWRPNMCRHKRQLEAAGQLIEVGKGICPITGFKAALLSCNENIIQQRQRQLRLAM